MLIQTRFSQQSKAALRHALENCGPLNGAAGVASALRRLVACGGGNIPFPGSGRTLERWQALCDVAATDLSLAKLYEGHTDALAILHELEDANAVPEGSSWGVWAAEPPDSKVIFRERASGGVSLHGRKAWCSGAATVSHALLTAWQEDGSGPFLVKLALDQEGISISDERWQAVGMAASASFDVTFESAVGTIVGECGDYLARKGFWHGGAGIAACWFGGSTALAKALTDRPINSEFLAVAIGKVDLCLSETRALLREAAGAIDESPDADAEHVARRVRLSAERTAGIVLNEVGRNLGATPYCRNLPFARMAADLPVFLRQSHADRDYAEMGKRFASEGGDSWRL